jgi:steroid delta-isomerase-like uncharacterized protein
MRRAMAFLLLALAPACVASNPLPASSSSATASEQERNKAIARRVFEEILSQGKFQVANEIYAPDFVNHGLHHNASLKQDQDAARWEKQAMPDMRVSVEKMIAEGDMVSVLWHLQGTNSHAAGWLPATGVRIEERGITIWRIADGRIHDEWTTFDIWNILRQSASQLAWQLVAAIAVLAILFWVAIRLLVLLFRSARRLVRAVPA